MVLFISIILWIFLIGVSGDEIYQERNFTDGFPYVCNSKEQLENVSVGELAVFLDETNDNQVYVSLFNDSIQQNLFTVCMNDYREFEQRLDLEDPFSDLGYVIPWQILPYFEFVAGDTYTISVLFCQNVEPRLLTFTVNKSIKNTDIPLTHPLPTPTPTITPDPMQPIIDSNKETQNKLDEQTNAIKENNETNKNIFQKLGDILSFINPFSENFFAYKLVELLIEGLKGLFVPEDGFFSDYFNEIKQWFSDRLGFLWSPFDFLIELLTRIMNINFGEPKFTVPDIYEPFTNQKIISATEFNFNDLLSNSILKTAHDIYLLLVDGFIIFGLYQLISHKIEEVFTKW